MQVILIKYEVPESQVLLDTFVKSALAAQASINAINEEYFNNEAYFELVVFPPEAGSLKKYIGVTLKVVGGSYLFLWSIIQAMDSETVQDISKELIGQEPSEVVIEKIQRWKKSNKSAQEITDESAQIAIELIEEFVVASCEAGFVNERETLSKLPSSQHFRYKLEAAQAQLFEGVLGDAGVLGISFSGKPLSPIPRQEFAARAIQPRKPDEDMPNENWRVSIEFISVSSPNFDKNDHFSRKCKGRITSGSVILFDIRDEDFWQSISSLEFGEKTTLGVQLATKYVEGRARERRVVRVLKINGEEFGQALDENALAAVLGNYSNQPDDDGQIRLFEED